MPTTSDQLVEKVLRKCFWPALDENPPLDAADILALADDEIAGTCWPKLIGSNADYYVSKLDYAITADQALYRCPERAFGPIRDVVLVDDDGNGTSISKMDLEDLGRPNALPPSVSGYYHYFSGDFLGLHPIPESTEETLRIRYFPQPGKLALSATSTTVSAIDLSATPDRFTVAANPDSWTSSTFLDVISKGNAHQLLAGDLDVSSIVTSTTFVFTAAELAGKGIRVGDYVVEAGYSPIVQVPDFMIPWLVELVSTAALVANGDRQAASDLVGSSREKGNNVTSVGTPRSLGEANVIITRNSPYR